MTVRVVAEAGQCNNGSVGTAIDMAKMARLAGAQAIKFQLLRPETIAQPDAPKYWYEDGLGTSNQREAFAKAGLVPYEKWGEVKGWCDDLGIEFLATPFDLEAVDALEAIGVRYYKIASGDITYQALCERIAATGKPVILSTGASYQDEIDRALGWLAGCPVTLLACTLSYPTPANAAHLARIPTLKALYPECEIGYSDHTSMPETALAATALGATLLEVHYTLNNQGPDVPDHRMAVNPERLAQYVEAAELGEKLRGSPSIEPVPEELAARNGARRSLCVNRPLKKGHRVTADDLIALRPGGGIPPFGSEHLIGKRLRHDYAEGEAI